jgi:hypothetical protein
MGLTANSVTFEWTLGEIPVFTISSDSFNIGNDNMSWNYRVIMEPAAEGNIFGEDSYTIREVFYDDDGEIEFWSDDGCAPYGNTFQEVADDFDLMAAAFELPVLKIVKDEDGLDKLVEIEVEYEYPDEGDDSEEDEEEEA